MYNKLFPQGEGGRDHDYGDGLLVYRSDGELEGEEGYSSSAVSEEEVKYDPSVWQSVIRYGPERELHPAARGLVIFRDYNVMHVLKSFLCLKCTIARCATYSITGAGVLTFTIFI